MPRTIIATTASQLQALHGLWHSLFQPGVHSLFQSFAWNLLAARAFPGQAPHVVAVEDDAGAALLPACLASGTISLLGDALFDYRDLLAAGDPGPAAHALAQLVPLRLPLRVTALRGTGATERWQRLGVSALPFVHAPCLCRAAISPEQFDFAHGRSLRLLRRLAHVGVTFREYPGSNSALVRLIYERKAGRSLEGGDNLFADPARRQFLVAAAALGSCDVFAYESPGGALVAALVTFRDAGVRRFYTIDYDPAWAHFSPGVALLLEVARRSLASGWDCDFMTGEQPFKLRFATSSVPLYRVAVGHADLAALAGHEQPAAA